jgi:hypothetical protein
MGFDSVSVGKLNAALSLADIGLQMKNVAFQELAEGIGCLPDVQEGAVVLYQNGFGCVVMVVCSFKFNHSSSTVSVRSRLKIYRCLLSRPRQIWASYHSDA